MQPNHDLDLLKDIPGYKAILKALIKSQIQQLVEQLATHTDEESVLLTASVTDGSLSHLGSESGKVFLDSNDDIKSKFLGFCLKRHHKSESNDTSQTQVEQSGVSKWQTPVSRNHFSPASQPYPKTRPRLNQSLVNFTRDPTTSSLTSSFASRTGPASSEALASPALSTSFDMSLIFTNSQGNSSLDSGMCHTTVKSEIMDKTGEVSAEVGSQRLEVSENWDSNQDKSISAKTDSSASKGDESFVAHVKVEAMSEEDLELEITAVEPGTSQSNEADQSVDWSSYAGNQTGSSIGEDIVQLRTSDWKTIGPDNTINNLPSIDYTPMEGLVDFGSYSETREHRCVYCDRKFQRHDYLTKHLRIHTGEKPYQCYICRASFSQKNNMNRHIQLKHALRVSRDAAPD